MRERSQIWGVAREPRRLPATGLRAAWRSFPHPPGNKHIRPGDSVPQNCLIGTWTHMCNTHGDAHTTQHETQLHNGRIQTCTHTHTTHTQKDVHTQHTPATHKHATKHVTETHMQRTDTHAPFQIWPLKGQSFLPVLLLPAGPLSPHAGPGQAQVSRAHGMSLSAPQPLPGPDHTTHILLCSAHRDRPKATRQVWAGESSRGVLVP